MQPEPHGMTETDLKKHNREQTDAGARHPCGYTTPTPKDGGGNGLRECSEQRCQRNARMDADRVLVSRQEEPCGYCLDGNEAQIHEDKSPNPLDTVFRGIGDCRDFQL